MFYNSKLKTVLLLFCISVTIAHAETNQNVQKQPKTLFTKLKNHNLATIEWEAEDWDTDDYIEYLNHIAQMDRNPSAHLKRSRAFQFMQDIEKRFPVQQNGVIDPDTWSDLNLFAGKKDLSIYVCSKLDRTVTELGKVNFFGMVANPTQNVEDITKTQNIIKELVQNQKLFEASQKAIRKIEKSENVTLSFWGRDSFKQATKREYFNFAGFDNEKLNNNEALLEVKSLYGHGSRIINIGSTALASVALCAYGTLILTNVIEVPEWLKTLADRSNGAGGPLFSLLSFIENKWVHGASSIASGVICGVLLKNEIEWAKGNILLEKCVQQKLMHVANYLSCMKELNLLWKSNPVLRENFPDLANIDTLFTKLAQKSEKLNELLELLQTETFEGEPSFFSDHGNILLAYKLMHDVKNNLEDAIGSVGKIDAYIAIAQLYKEFETKPVKFCFVQFTHDETPFVDLVNFWNPFINPEKVVPNSITLGSTQKNRNVIITGPNAGGKSTILKAIAVNIILAQSIGIAPSESLTLTPFTKIASYLNIADDIAGGNSLFKSEVLRAQSLLETVEKQKDHAFTFTIFDEIFSGTSPKEGEAAAFSVAKHLGEFKNNMSVIATHFSLLTSLEKVSSYFSNYKVTVNHLRDGNISYPFKLEPGISDQHIAIDILRIEGFNTKILDDAHAIINKR